MTPRQRVLAALSHRETDRPPIDLGGTMCSSLTGGANKKLKSFLDMETAHEEVTNPLTDSIAVSEELLRMFGVEFRTVRLKGPEQVSDTVRAAIPEDGIRDEFGTIWKKAGSDYVPFDFSYADAAISDLKRLPKPDPYDPGRSMEVRKEAESLRNAGEYAVIADFVCGGPFEQAQRIRGFEQFLVDLHTDSEFAVALLDLLTENAIGFWDVMLNETGDLIDVLCQGDDLGMQTSLMISPEAYRKFVKPCHKRLFDFIRTKTPAKIWLHSCGSVYEIIPDFIEVGVQALNPVQVSAVNMDLKKLKDEFGKDITFWGGGVDIQKLPFLGEQEIRDEVRKAIDIMAPGGGFVFAASHNILPDTPGANIYAAYAEAGKYSSHV